jgi:DNA transposition AAA+ family ATPase
MGVFHGPAGYGKTIASTIAMNTHDAVLVELDKYATPKYVLGVIAGELGLGRKGTTSDLLETVSGELARTGRMLIVDEADQIAKKGHAEIIRALYDKSRAAVIMIGEERLPKLLEKEQRVHSRVLKWVAAQPNDLHDAQELAKVYAPSLSLSDDLLTDIVAASRGSARLINNNINKVREHAIKAGLRTLDRANCTSLVLENGRAPMPRTAS